MWSNIEILLIAPQFAAGLLLEGLLIGAVFALIAYGLALVWGVMNVKNLAQGPFVIAGGYVAWFVQSGKTVDLGFASFQMPYVHPVLGMLVAAVVMWALSWMIYQYIVSKVLEMDMFVSLLATFGVAYVLEQSLSLMFTQDTQTIDLGWGSLDVFSDGMVLLAWQKIMAFVICCVLAVFLVIFMKRSRMGQSIRATAQNARAARVMGIDTDRVYRLHVLPERRDLRRGRRAGGDDLGHPALLRDHLFDPGLRPGRGGRPGQPGRRDRGGLWYGGTGAIRWLHPRRAVPAGGWWSGCCWSCCSSGCCSSRASVRRWHEDPALCAYPGGVCRGAADLSGLHPAVLGALGADHPGDHLGHAGWPDGLQLAWQHLLLRARDVRLGHRAGLGRASAGRVHLCRRRQHIRVH